MKLKKGINVSDQDFLRMNKDDAIKSLIHSDNLEERVFNALDNAYCYSGIDGGHHKEWVIDTMVKTLLGEDAYKKFVEHYEVPRDKDDNVVSEGDDAYEDGDYYECEWSKGIAP